MQSIGKQSAARDLKGEVMKFRSISILAALLIITLSMAMAWPKGKKTVKIAEPTIVGSVTLQPGEYNIAWSGAGPDVQVNFSRGDKTIATVPATLEAVQNEQDSIVTLQASGSSSLVEINLKNARLHFGPRDASSGN